jgi:hypothetical protein
MWEHYFVIPIGKDTSKIPKGDYCYKFIKGKTKWGNPKTKCCPYLTCKKINGSMVAWCDYLELGGLLNEGTEKSYKKLIEFFGGEEILWDYMPLDLLFDSCKSCGVNKYTLEKEKKAYGKWLENTKENEGGNSSCKKS